MKPWIILSVGYSNNYKAWLLEVQDPSGGIILITITAFDAKVLIDNGLPEMGD